MKKLDKVAANLEILSDYLSDAKSQEDAQAYQVVAHAMFMLEVLRKKKSAKK